MNLSVDINADLGEGSGHDKELFELISSANIATGFHAGDSDTMHAAISAAKNHGVAVGAHPSFLDRENFGRKELTIPPEEVFDAVAYQLGIFQAIASALDVQPNHVKPHGALYNMACRDVALAGAVARAVAAFSHGLILLGPPGSELLKAGSALGLRVVGEAFADRAYEPDGSLVSRKKLGAVIHDVDVVVERSIRLAKDRTVVAIDGSIVHLRADTICVHGDTPGADELAAKLRAALERSGVEVKPMAAA